MASDGELLEEGCRELLQDPCPLLLQRKPGPSEPSHLVWVVLEMLYGSSGWGRA